jgi:hypothetical protein
MAVLGGLNATQTTISASPIGQQAVTAPPVAVRIQHTWKQWQNGALREYRDESLGTIIAPDLILTHSHYSRPQATWLEEIYLFEDEPIGLGSRVQRITLDARTALSACRLVRSRAVGPIDKRARSRRDMVDHRIGTMPLAKSFSMTFRSLSSRTGLPNSPILIGASITAIRAAGPSGRTS